MKAIKYTFFMTILIFFIYLYFFNTQRINKIKQNHDSIGSVNSIVDSPIKQKSNKEKAKTNKLVDLQKQNKSGLIENHKKNERELSYLDAYRSYKFILSCNPVYHKLKPSGLLSSFFKNTDPLESFINNKKQFLGKEPSILQIEYFQKYIDKCMSFLEDESKDYIVAITETKQRFDMLQPKTEEEIALATALQIEKQIEQNERLIAKQKMGSELLTPEEKKKRNKQVIALTQELQLIMENMDDEQGVSEEKMAQLTKMIKEMQETMMPNANVMTDEIKYAQTEIQKSQHELSDFFKANQTPDVFLIFANHLLNNNKGRNFIEDEINVKLGVFDEYYIKTLNDVVVPLIACSLDYPCDAESDYTIKYCIDNFQDHEQACGKNLEDYFLDYYLGKNQLIDVYNYLNFLLNNYA